MTHLSLFSGIGGMDLAAHWAGFRTVAMVEKEPFCQRVLAARFPGIPIHGDINEFDPMPFRDRVSVVSGGFPCQDLSDAGKGIGLRGGRSGLWFRMLDIIRCVRPRFVLAENVPGIRTKRGEFDDESAIDSVLRGLEEEGYTCGAFVVGACDVGAPHIRKRVFIVGESAAAGVAQVCGDSCRSGFRGESWRGTGQESENGHGGNETSMANADGAGPSSEFPAQSNPKHSINPVSASNRPSLRIGSLADADGGREQQPGRANGEIRGRTGNGGQNVADSDDSGRGELRFAFTGEPQFSATQFCGRGESESRLGRVAYGIPDRLDGPFGDWFPGWPAGKGEAQKAWEPPRLAVGVPNRQARLKALGNAVVPQQAYIFFAAFAEWMKEDIK